MLLMIIESTPLFVWAILAGVTALGLSQIRTRTIGIRRAAVLPAIFVILSLAGVVNSFGGNALAFAAWAAGIGVAVAVGVRLLPRLKATWHANGESVRIAGSWLPLALALALFLIKYVAGVSLAFHPDLARQTNFVIACSLAFGLSSGLFAARGMQLWLARGAALA